MSGIIWYLIGAAMVGYCLLQGLYKYSLNSATQNTLKAAQNGDSNAQLLIAMCYRDGSGGMPKDMEQATGWIRKAAEGGLATAQAELGSLYSIGAFGLEKDAKEAAKWFKKAAEQGNAKGQVALGYLYSSGDGGHAEDHVEAVRYFQAAANDGNAIAQYALGECYLHGKGVEEDLKLAHQCFVSASNEIPRAGVLAAMAERLLSEQQSEMKKNAGRSSDG